MANIFPEMSDEFNNSYGEYLIFNALKKLQDDWNIYYSVNWQKKIEMELLDGEKLIL